jgi:hypothetical protein
MICSVKSGAFSTLKGSAIKDSQIKLHRLTTMKLWTMVNRDLNQLKRNKIKFLRSAAGIPYTINLDVKILEKDWRFLI